MEWPSGFWATSFKPSSSLSYPESSWLPSFPRVDGFVTRKPLPPSRPFLCSTSNCTWHHFVSPLICGQGSQEVLSERVEFKELYFPTPAPFTGYFWVLSAVYCLVSGEALGQMCSWFRLQSRDKIDVLGGCFTNLNKFIRVFFLCGDASWFITLMYALDYWSDRC